MPIKNRRIFPPGGWRFFQPETNWSPNKGLDFDATVDAIIAHRRSNPRFNLSVDRESVVAELDAVTCLRLNNNPDYCSPASNFRPAPPSLRQPPGLVQSAAAGVVAGAKQVVAEVRHVTAGIGILLDWLGNGAQAVSLDQAHARAKVCVACSENRNQKLVDLFTTAAANTIRKQLEIRSAMKLSTELDSNLHICNACGCVLRLKVHVPMQHILTNPLPSNLPAHCWMLHEKSGA